MLYACASLSCSRFCHAWHPLRPWSCLVTFNAHEALFRCDHLGSIRMLGYYIHTLPFPLCAIQCLPCLFTPLLHSMHLYMLAHMSMHESCLLVCCPCFNIMKLWTFAPNLHLFLMDTTFFLLSCLFAFSLVFLLSFFFACHVYHAYLLVSCLCLCMYTHGAMTHGARAWSPKSKQKERGCEHMDISQSAMFSRFRGLTSPILLCSL